MTDLSTRSPSPPRATDPRRSARDPPRAAGQRLVRPAGRALDPPERRARPVVLFTEVDDIRLAQFYDVIEEHGSVASLINAGAKRVVLILGRFLPRRKRVLDRLAVALQERGKIPVIFDFPGPEEREISDTVRFIAGMSQFIVVDMTKASSVPLELQSTIPDLRVEMPAPDPMRW